MDVNQMYEIWKYAIAKNLQQGYGSPSDFYITINQAQRSYQDYLLGEYQKYQIKRPIAVVEFGQNERIRDSLAPLIYSAILPINSTTGISPFPSDYEYVDAMWSIYGNYNIKFTQQDRLDMYVHSEIDPIVSNPVYLIQHEGFHFYPERPYGENQAKMSYVRDAPSIVWGYVDDSNGIPVWNPATSQNPVWSDTDCYQIIVRALMLVGVNLQFNTVIQYSNDIKNTGQ
jgi:hypothetical protein